MNGQGWKLEGERLKERSKRLPLIAPNETEQKFYEKYVQKVKGNCLVLGATPEPRDVAIRNGLKCYAVDISQNMLDKFTPLMKYKDSNLNIMIQNNWLNMEFEDNFFDIALGDGSFFNIVTKRDYESIIKILRKIIKPNGFLILREVHSREIEPLSLKKVVLMYRNNEITLSDFFAEIRLVIPLKKCLNKETYQMSAEDVFNLIDREYKKGVLNKEERDKLFLYKNKLVNLIYPKKEFISLFEKYGFKLIEESNFGEYRFQKYGKMFAFQKTINNIS